MTLEQELETTLAAAGRHARPDEQAVAVMATEPAGARVYVVAFAAGDDLGYVALDGAGAPVSDRRLVKDAVALAALAERAEEVSGATLAEELVERFGEAAASAAPDRRQERGRRRRGRGRRGGPPGRRRRRPAAGDAASTSTGSPPWRPSWRRRWTRSSRTPSGCEAGVGR